jgi:hypothetical protein
MYFVLASISLITSSLLGKQCRGSTLFEAPDDRKIFFNVSFAGNN